MREEVVARGVILAWEEGMGSNTGSSRRVYVCNWVGVINSKDPKPPIYSSQSLPPQR
jgi:hypothetical protein